jgi:dTDP-4-amino-4,6-dideoxygalactose transaminase
MLGYNFRMTDLNAAIGIPQMERLADLTAKRRGHAAYYNQHIESVITPQVRPGYGHVWHQYTVRVNGKRDRDAAVSQLNDAGVGTGVFYPVPAHQQKHIRDFVGDLDLPVAEQMAQQVISLPVHPQLTLTDLEQVASEVNKL